ncbi:MAG: Stp1/IreP family PP2C-type Ser/Thr phosphatase [Ilumatobacteraceae bacterium]|jgi:serine/threonine protein phosphatase PrpC
MSGFSSGSPLLMWGAHTDVGRVRQGNEDAFVAEEMVFAVADGMGGHNAGEVASAIAATTLRDRLSEGAASVDLAIAAVVEANAAIFAGAHGRSDQRGMGTTLTALAVLHTSDATRLVVANVGDSRTYLLRNGRLRRVSVDHSYVQELVSTGHITEQEARRHPRRNIVTRALGIEPTVRVDTWVMPLVRGDRYVLCSDGLVDEVDDPEILAILQMHSDPQRAAEDLVEAANVMGGRDNTTVVVVDVLEGDDPADETNELAVVDAPTEERERLIDADSPSMGIARPDGADVTAAIPVVGADSTAGPDDAARSLRRSRLGVLLFLIGLGMVVTLAVVGIMVARHDGSTPATTTTSTSTTTTVADTTTSSSTSTTTSTSTTSTSTTGG